MEFVRKHKTQTGYINVSCPELTAVFQRLGYILEHVLERADLAETLYSKMEVAGLKFRKIPFKINKPTEGCEVDKKWKVIINQEIEIDE